MSRNTTRILLIVSLILWVYLIIFNLPAMNLYEKLISNSQVANVSFVGDFIRSQLRDSITAAPDISDEAMAEDVEILYPNFPIKYLVKVRKQRHNMYFENKSCAPIPDLLDLDVDKEYWQQVYMTNTLIQVYSAHYDDRFENERTVRVMSMVNRTWDKFLGRNKTLYCQLWFKDESKPVAAPMNKSEYMWFPEWDIHVDGDFGPYLLGCAIPKSHISKIPVVVSVVEHFCDKARNLLKVINERPDDKKEFAVCVKGLDFLQYDIAFRLVEWMEFLYLMGVDKIFFYKYEVHPKVQRVLDYYVALNRADVRQATISSHCPAMRFVQHFLMEDNIYLQMLNEIIYYNDCFYRNKHKYDFISLLDVDEIICPMKDKNWHDLLQRAIKSTMIRSEFNSFSSRHIFFLDVIQKKESYPGIPPYMLMMQHIIRTRYFSYPGAYVKSIFSTKHVISCHNHYPITTVPNTTMLNILEEDARMQHYRDTCHPEEDCEPFLQNPVKDTRMWDFKDQLVPNVNEALVNMGLIDI